MSVPPKFYTNKIFLIVRNPLDSIFSQANLSQTRGHSLQVENEYHVDFPEWWDKFVKSKIALIKEFFEFVHSKMDPQVPIHFMRYEDLVVRPNDELCKLFSFLLDVESVEGTVIEQRIFDLAEAGNERNTVYKTK